MEVERLAPRGSVSGPRREGAVLSTDVDTDRAAGRNLRVWGRVCGGADIRRVNVGHCFSGKRARLWLE